MPGGTILIHPGPRGHQEPFPVLVVEGAGSDVVSGVYKAIGEQANGVKLCKVDPRGGRVSGDEECYVYRRATMPDQLWKFCQKPG